MLPETVEEICSHGLYRNCDGHLLNEYCGPLGVFELGDSSYEGSSSDDVMNEIMDGAEVDHSSHGEGRPDSLEEA